MREDGRWAEREGGRGGRWAGEGDGQREWGRVVRKSWREGG